MICQLKKFEIKRATRVFRVLLLLGGLALLLQTPALAIILPPPTQSVTFGWDASTDTNVVGYNIYYGSTSHVYTSKVPLGNVTSATISGLVVGTTYYFAATTYDSLNQESTLSDEIAYTVTVPVTNTSPTITGMTTTNMAIVGQNVTFSVTATGTGPLTYQWMQNASSIAAATNAVLTLNNVTAAQAGAYYVTVSNIAGSISSPTTGLAVYPTMAATLATASKVNGQFALNISGVTNFQYVVQASTNLVDWVPVQTNTAPFTFVDANAGQSKQRFYRACLPDNPASNASNPDITNGLVAWYPFAGNANDYSSSGNNSTPTASPTYSTGPNGAANTAINFDGHSQYVTANGVSLTTSFTISYWVNSTVNGGGTSANNFIFANGNTSDSMGFAWNHSNSTYAKSMYVQDGSSSYYPAQLSSTLNSNTWYFIVFTWDGSTLKGSVNNVAATGGTPLGSLKTVAGNLVIGGAYGNYFPGKMAGFRIYNRALSPTETGTLYTNGINGNIF